MGERNFENPENGILKTRSNKTAATCVLVSRLLETGLCSVTFPSHIVIISNVYPLVVTVTISLSLICKKRVSPYIYIYIYKTRT
jgi:hypothetical protein